MPLDADAITERLAADLRAGVFPPGAWLKQVDLQKRYGVGRAPVRKALEVLAGRRLIRHEMNRGFSVHPADNEETDQILAIRVAIETGFADDICAKATSDDITRLAALAETFARLAQDGEFEPLYDINLEFHRALLGCAGNAPMVALIEDLRLRTSPAPASQWLQRARILRSAQEHLSMVRAVQNGTPRKLAELIRQHIEQG